MAPRREAKMKPLPAPWDRIFRHGTRMFVWGSIAGILYLLRPFFLLVFLTFVFAYVQSHGVDALGGLIRDRIARVVLVFLVFLGTLVGIGTFVAPHIEKQAADLGSNYPTILAGIDDKIKEIAHKNGFLSVPKDFSSEELIKDFLGGTPKAGEEKLKSTAKMFLNVGTVILAVSSAFLLSLLFSFLIVLDLPNLVRKTKKLADTKIGWIYEEVADSIYNFCRILGRALEAQFFIAIVNTILTATGLHILGLPEVVVLATAVFFCSFIPVAGVFLSSTPICLVALQTSGLELMLLCIGLILIVHFIEAYFLNPLIYGHHLRMNAVLVLIVLTIGGKLFGVWGLVLGLPVVNYIFGYAIRQEKESQAPATEQGRPAKSA